MKLITYQSYDAVKNLFSKGFLECDSSKINKEKMELTYKWIIQKMNERIDNKYNTKYPLWCWVKCYNKISPPRRKGKKIKGYDVKITFNKDEKDVFITDYKRYSFLLNNRYIPRNKKEKDDFDKKLEKYKITENDLKLYVRKDLEGNRRNDESFLKVCNEINKSFDRCITKESDILQGCIWRINLSDIEKIEILNDEDYINGSLNYIRSDGKRIDWINNYYKTLK